VRTGPKHPPQRRCLEPVTGSNIGFAFVLFPTALMPVSLVRPKAYTSATTPVTVRHIPLRRSSKKFPFEHCRHEGYPLFLPEPAAAKGF
jgi:hypothetical protein